MQLLNVLAPLGLLACSVQAAPNKWGNWDNNKCVTSDHAQYIVDQSIVFLQHKDVAAANAAARSIFDPNIQEFGDSINSLRGDPLGTQVENGIEKYITETLSTPVIPSITTIDIIKDCHKFVWQWQFDGIGSGMYRVRGSTTITVDENSGLVTYQYVEFNSLAWGEDIGFQVTVPPGLFGPGS